jgi:hypothetical protein
MKCVVTVKPGKDSTTNGLLWHRDLAQVWAGYPEALHAPLLDLLHMLEVAFPLRNTAGEPLGASVIVPRLGSMKGALQERDPNKERKVAARAKGAAVQQLFVRYAARAVQGEQMEEEKEEEGAESSGSSDNSSSSDDEDGGGATRFPPDFVGRLLARLHRFAMRDAAGDGSSCGGAWQGGCILGYSDNTALLQVVQSRDGEVLELDVWGTFPITLRDIIHGAVQSLAQEHYPGIELEVSIPCPCRDKKQVDGADGTPIKCCKDTDGAAFKGAALRAGLARLVAAEAEAANANAGDAKVAALVAVKVAAEASECGRCHQKHPIRVLLPESDDQPAHGGYMHAYMAMQQLEEYVPPPPDPKHRLVALGGSNYAREYAALMPPQHRDQLLWAMRSVVAGYCALHRVPEANGKDFLRRLLREWALGGSVATAAQRLWTSQETLFVEGEGGAPPCTIEFCSLWSEVIRCDQAPLALPSAMIARAINLNLVGAPTCDRKGMATALTRGNFPEDCCLWRGGNFGVAGGADELWKFFQPGKTYRAPQFLATSRNERTAWDFVLKAHEAHPDRELVLWKVELDPRGAAEAEFRCRHVNLITQGHVDEEREYLFSAFTVFTVKEIWHEVAGGRRPGPSPTPTTLATPHHITITPALDNKLQPCLDGSTIQTPWPADLPLAKWC